MKQLVKGYLSDICSTNILDHDYVREDKEIFDRDDFYYAINHGKKSTQLLGTYKDYPLVFISLDDDLFFEPISGKYLTTSVDHYDEDKKYLSIPIGVFKNDREYFDKLSYVKHTPLCFHRKTSIYSKDPLNPINPEELVDEEFLREYSKKTVPRKKEVKEDLNRLEKEAYKELEKQMPIITRYIENHIMPYAEMEDIIKDSKIKKLVY